ncbi:magnesium/cobalt transporter CorA [Candidatus Bipolaricaulota bacterium]|nr:magnesium/cobalt transporter CorA [Candidatus Bipolaricaulota bacterium]
MKSYLIQKDKVESVSDLDDCLRWIREEEGFIWIDIEGSEFDKLEEISEDFGLHPLSIEDSENKRQRPKLELFSDYIFLIIRTPNPDLEQGEVDSLQLALFLGENFLITVHREDIKSIEEISEKLNKGGTPFITKGPDFLAHSIVDYSVDRFLTILEGFDHRVEEIEDSILDNPSEEILQKISDVRGEILYLQRVINPLRDEIGKLTRRSPGLVSDEVKVYFRDIEDNLTRCIELLINYRELISGTRDMYMTSISNRMNEVMQTLTIIATIFIPLTFIAGVYGMNFSFIPELDWQWGYFWVLGVMGLVTVGMVVYFKSKDWF